MGQAFLGTDVGEIAPMEGDIPQAHVPTGGHVSVSRTLTTLPTEEELATSTLWPEVEKIYGHGYEVCPFGILSKWEHTDGKLI